jgi:hypothetical protein
MAKPSKARVRARGEAPERPAVRPLHGGASRGLVGLRVDALVEHHHDVGAERGLHLDRALGREQVRPLVDVALEARALLVDRAILGQGEDLVAPRVGEHRAVPAHEGVHPSHAPEELGAGTEEQVIGVREHHLRLHRL